MVISMGTIEPKLAPYFDEYKILAFDNATMFGKDAIPDQADLQMISNCIDAHIGTSVRASKKKLFFYCKIVSKYFQRRTWYTNTVLCSLFKTRKS